MGKSIRKKKNRVLTEDRMLFVSTEEFTATAATVTECYFKVTVYSFGGILRDERLSMVFFECRDLSML